MQAFRETEACFLWTLKTSIFQEKSKNKNTLFQYICSANMCPQLLISLIESIRKHNDTLSSGFCPHCKKHAQQDMAKPKLIKAKASYTGSTQAPSDLIGWQHSAWTGLASGLLQQFFWNKDTTPILRGGICRHSAWGPAYQAHNTGLIFQNIPPVSTRGKRLTAEDKRVSFDCSR